MTNIIICLVGSILMIIGFIVPYAIYLDRDGVPKLSFLRNFTAYDTGVSYYLDPVMSIIFVFLIGILAISIVAVIYQASSKSNLFTKQKIHFISLAIFFLFPLFDSYGYETMAILLTETLSSTTSSVAQSKLTPLTYEYDLSFGIGFYIFAIGFLFLTVSFFLSTQISFRNWSKRKNANELNRYEKESNKVPLKIKTLVLNILGILSSIGIIIGISLPNYTWIYRITEGDFRNPSILFPDTSYYDVGDLLYQRYLDITPLFYILLISFVLIGFICNILSSIKRSNKLISKATIIFFIAITLVLPTTSPWGVGQLWRPTAIVLLMSLNYIFGNAASTSLRYELEFIDYKSRVTFAGWYYYVSILLLLVLFIILVILLLLKTRKLKLAEGVEEGELAK